jgi:hypothetical protein
VADKHIKDLEAALVADPNPSTAPSPTGALALPPPTVTPPTSPRAANATDFPPPAASANTRNPQALALAAPPPTATDAPFATNPSGGVPPSSDESHPIYTKWWFWTGVGAVVVGGVLILLLASRDPACPAGRMCQ